MKKLTRIAYKILKNFENFLRSNPNPPYAPFRSRCLDPPMSNMHLSRKFGNGMAELFCHAEKRIVWAKPANYYSKGFSKYDTCSK